MRNYYISDLHFHHPKAIHMDERPFDDLEDMHQKRVNLDCRIAYFLLELG